MNNAAFQQFKNWQKSRNDTTFPRNNNLYHFSKSNISSNNISKKLLNDKSKKQEPSTKSRYFKSKFSKSISEKQINFQIINEKTVYMNLNFLPKPNLISIFREFGMLYNIEIKEWILSFINYNPLYKTLQNFTNTYKDLNIYHIPPFIIELMFSEERYSHLEFLIKNDHNSKLKSKYLIDYTSDSKNLPKLNSMPKNLYSKLYRFQKQGIAFGIGKYARLLIADEMGVGKTVQAIGLSSYYINEWPVLVICPSSLKFAWRDEISTWLNELLTKNEIQIIKKTKNEFKENKKFYIISYDLSVRMIEKIINKNFKFIIVDEAHYLKNRQAKRTILLTPILQKSKRVILLTGTPIMAKPMEIYPLLHILRPDHFKSFIEFGARYCDPKKNFGNFIDYSGSSNTKELNAILNKFIMIRRLKKDVLSELPPKKRQKIEISTDKKIIKVLKALMEKSTEKFEKLLGQQLDMENVGINIDDLKGGDEKNNNEENSDQKDNSKNKKSIVNKFNKAYLLTGQSKLPGIRDYVNYLIDNSCKFLIFAHHTEILDTIEQVVKEDKVQYIRIDGKVKIEDREDLVHEFQNNDDCLVAILSITACATGLTLTKASTVVFAELHFTPSIMIQAEDRVHRIGQEGNCVNIHYLFADNTLDVLLFRKLNEKQNIVSTTLDNDKKDLDVTKIKEKVGEFVNVDGKQLSVDERKNIAVKIGGCLQNFLSKAKSVTDKNEEEKKIGKDINFRKVNTKRTYDFYEEDKKGEMESEKEIVNIKENDENLVNNDKDLLDELMRF